MSVIGLSGAVLICAMLVLLLREWRPAMALPLRLTVAVLVAGMALSLYAPIVGRIGEMLRFAEGGELATPLFRAAGIAMICELTALFCRDMGEQTLAVSVQWFGKIEILLLCLPLLDGLLAVAKELLT